MKDARQIIFHATGGSFDGQKLMIPPPIRWEKKALVFRGRDGTWENYLFSRIDYSAKFIGEMVPNTGAGL